MRWQVKAAILYTLSQLPAGTQIYRKLQDVTGSNRLDIHDQYGMKSAFLKRILQEGLPVRDREFFEIGTGWFPVFPMLLSLVGARRIVTVDLNPWLTADSLAQTLLGYASIAERVAADFQLSARECQDRLHALINLAKQPNATVDAVLREARIEYRMPLDATDTRLPAETFDYIVSSNVLEHIPGPVIAGIIAESQRILKPGGLHLHHVDPGDHYSLDGQITTVNFLNYSRHQWHCLGRTGLAYHNRLRCIDYVRLFQQGGFEIFREFTRIDERALAVLREGKLKVHPDFQGYTPEQLAGAGIDVFARKRELPAGA